MTGQSCWCGRWLRYRPRPLPPGSLAFYEDLPYAVWPDERDEGLVRFKALLGKRGWRGIAFPLGQALAGKLSLLNLYESQHAQPPAISDYTPQTRQPQPPHEAIWVSGRL